MFIHGTHSPAQEREARGYRWLWAGVPSAPVVAIERRTWVTVREEPWHPSSFSWPGVRPVDPIRVQPGVAVFVAQEQPWHPGSFVGAPALPPAAPWRERRHWITVVEQPWHPTSWVQTSLPPAFIAPGRRAWQTTVEQPWHPSPRVWFTPATSIPPFVNAGRSAGLLITKVEQPWHPQSFINGPNTLPSGSPLGFGKRRPLFLASQGGFPASYWPDANG